MAILENAYNIGYEKEANSIWSASFSLPLNDPKVDKVEHLQYVEITDDLTDEYIGLFRIMPKLTQKSAEANTVQFQCEHVLSTLLDSSLFKYHQLSGYNTKQVIEYLLDQQNHKHWVVGDIDIIRGFHYSWENENLLSALFSVPNPFDEEYLWTWDTTSYPWKLNLVKPETLPTARIKEGYNLMSFEIEENPMSSFNRIYPLGAGEGVNQLTIEDVNDGVPYLEDREPGEEIREYIWPDKRYTDAESLKADAQALLDNRKTPQITWTASAADVSSITGLEIDKLRLGKVVRLQINNMPTVNLRIVKESKSDITGNPGDIQLEIGNVTEDLGTTQSDLQRKQQINDLYAQGATNILTFGYQDNADSNVPTIIPFYIDDDVVNVNTCELTFRTKPFRAYSRATAGGGATVKSTSSGGGRTATSSSGGGTSRSTSSGGGTSRSTASGGSTTQSSGIPNFGVTAITTRGPSGTNYDNHVHRITTEALDHYHNVSFPSHTHGFTIPAHTHDFNTPNHTHKVDIPNHRHEIVLPNHTHNVKHEIVELDDLPDKVTIKVDGNTVPHTNIKGDRINLVDYIDKDDNGKIKRGRHELEITPNALGRIEADLILRVFIQSRLGGVY